ncbi:MAG: MMPL family transporter [gamma proteobacterium endosymbiont of Lamellibrachia anaximandri]|nr:MMPL family transporter [gamma proteobacterium endosymbiont of Lamellibrachia anaximandri]MBL3534358.1 MMPL family transporter [gamma proteobacterium endosymbiont of Lamellibrachia anaximandri]
MNRIISFAAKHPLPVLLIIAALTAAAVSRLDELRLNISAESMMVNDDPARTFYNHTLETFGADDVTILFLEDDALFTQEKLRAVRLALQKIEALPFVDHTESLFSIRHIKSVEGTVTAAPYLDEIPASQEQLEQIKDAALHNPLISGNLLSPTGTAMAINVYFKTERPAGFDQSASDGIDRALTPLSGKVKTFFQIGSPYVRTRINERIQQDQLEILPLSVLVLFMTLALSLRRLNGAVIPLLTAGLSVVWTLGLMAAFGIPVNVMTSIVPALLIVIGSTEDIHLLAEYHAGALHGMRRLDAIHAMGRNMGLAISLTFITTYLGFLSISLNDIELLQQFGMVASTGLLLNFLITIFLLPVCLRYLGERPVARSADPGSSPYHRLAGRIFQFVQTNKRKILALTTVAAIVSVYGAFSLRVNNTPLDYFDSDSDVTQRLNSLQERLVGMETFSIVLGSGIEGTFLKVRYLEEIKKLQDYLAQSGWVDKSLSFADFIALVNSVMEEETSGDPWLPESDANVQEYMLFIKHVQVSGLVSADFSEARILVRHHFGSSWKLKQALQEIRAFIDGQIDPGLDVQITGESILTNRAADAMAIAQAKSLALMIFAIFIIISLLFVNLKAGLVAVIPNLLPIIALFGVMGFAGISLDTGTATVAAIALGICVDHTMHFMVRYHRKTSSHQDEGQALADTVTQESLPIMAASIALASGFGALTLSSFPPVVYFGLLSAMVILLSLLATFVITPILLSSIRLITLWDMLSVRIKSQVLEHCALFRGMRPWQIKKIVLISNIQHFKQGEKIVSQGALGDEMFILLEGSAEVTQKQLDGSRKKLRQLAASEVFGEITLVSRIARTADVVALEDSSALAFKWEGIHQIARVFPRISIILFQNLSSILGNKLAGVQPEGVMPGTVPALLPPSE